MSYMVTFQKGNGQIFVRIKQSIGGMRIGDETSMGWKIIDIREEYCGNYLHHDDIRRYRRKTLGKITLKKKIVRFLVRNLNKLA